MVDADVAGGMTSYACCPLGSSGLLTELHAARIAASTRRKALRANEKFQNKAENSNQPIRVLSDLGETEKGPTSSRVAGKNPIKMTALRPKSPAFFPLFH